MKKVKNYNSCDPISNYELGTVYSFYLHNPQMSHLFKADKTTIQKYSDSLLEVINSNNEFVFSDGKYMNFVRVIGVVVDKCESNNPNNFDKITVMFKTSTDDYVINKYVVNTHNVYTNNKEYVTPAAVLCFTVD